MPSDLSTGRRTPRLPPALFASLFVLGSLGACTENPSSSGLSIEVSFPGELSNEAQGGRIIVIVSNREGDEPRFQYDLYQPETQLGFGVDVEDFGPGEVAVVDGSTLGFPLKSLNEIPPGEYRIQAVLNRYETFVRGDGHTVSFPPDQGEGQQWDSKPGNFHNVPQTVHLDPSQGGKVQLSLDQEIPPIPEFQDTPWIKHVRIQSDLLSEFWGRPMYLGAYVLLPAGFDEHPEARYPMAIHHGHFPRGFPEFSDEPPSPDLTDYDLVRAEKGFDLYQRWTSPGFPRMLAVKIEHANPFYDDSYAVNSQNVGPYGDAIVEELIPYLEERFRGIGEGWSRVMFGGSTGGWEVLGQQIFYPDEFNGAWSFCPDAVDFRHFETVDIYGDDNAYFMSSDWKRTPKPSGRTVLGHPFSMLKDDIAWEMVLGSRGRSGKDWAAWEAVYGPVGEDGYVAPIWDRTTGDIDHEVAEYWRENYDLRHILERDWATLGPKLVGKLRIYTGDMDDWYLNNAVYLMEEFLESTRDPHYGGLVEYGDRYGHCWTGDHEEPLEIQRLTVYQRFFPQFAEHIRRTAPAGADLTSWLY